ncbi:hypothetical protein FHG87_017760 [Trinorchestia longiramus]|nr:hypothetical protein FHG87_017760 [Trinorchestia longiramus]
MWSLQLLSSPYVKAVLLQQLQEVTPAATEVTPAATEVAPAATEVTPAATESSTRTMFQCTWRECRELAESCSEIESHIRRIHLGLSDRRRSRSLSSLHSTSDSDSEDDHEEDFYWTEVEVTVATNVDPATVGNSVVSTRLGATATCTVGNQATAPAAPTPESALGATLLPISHTTVISSPQPQVVAKPQPSKANSIITINSNPNSPHYRSGLASSLPSSQTAAASTLLTLHADASSPTARGAQPVRLTSPTSPKHHSVIHRTSPSPLGGGPRTNLSTHPYLQGGGWTSNSLSRAPLSKSVLKYSGGAPSYSQVSSPPTLSHMDMARPPHEDPEYRRQLNGGGTLLSSSWDNSSSYLTQSNEAVGAGGGKVRVTSSPKASPGRIGKRGGESKKCRKFYGMDQKNEWCTQCKWKKACTRFGNNS